MDVRYINQRRDIKGTFELRKKDKKVSAMKTFGICPGISYRKHQGTKEALEIVPYRKGKASVALET